MSGKNTIGIIEAITAPLGFFVLSLLIVETFLGASFFSNTFDQKDKITTLWIGVALFLVVLLVVSILVWFKPDHLTFDSKSHLINRGKNPFGTSDNPKRERDIANAARTSPEESE